MPTFFFKLHQKAIRVTILLADHIQAGPGIIKKVSFFDLHLSISDGFVKTNIYDKRDDFDFDIVNFAFLDGDVPRSTSCGVYISQLIHLLECPVMLMTLILVIRF